MTSISFTFVDLIIVFDVAAVVVLSAYALHEGVLLLLYLRHKLEARLHGALYQAQDLDKRGTLAPNTLAPNMVTHNAATLENVLLCDETLEKRLPSVTVQLPIYNERYVAERVIATVCALDYPRDLLQVQVLDDSTDDTSRIAQRAVEAGRDNGVDIELIHRDNRSGYKAGALANGLRHARGELIAIFDADFIPPRNFLQRMICQHRAFDDPKVAFVQTRWGHLNEEANALTRAQVVLLDMHFVIEQFARSVAGLGMNFNGSGGVWRREAIEAAGGWQSDTLTEDLDLSYRAQLKGWHGRYLDNEVCPGELPIDVLAFKRQQARWARGSAQCVRKLAVPILLSNMPLLHKAAAIMHVSGYFSNVFSLLLALVTPILMLLLSVRGTRAAPQWLSIFSIVGIAPLMTMIVAQWAKGNRRRLWPGLPAAIVLGIGMSLSNSVAVLRGLFDKSSGEFVRTPKSVAQLARPNGSQKRDRRDRHLVNRLSYQPRTDWTLRVELAIGLYALVICYLIAARGDWVAIGPILIYACGFNAVVLGQVAPWIFFPSQRRRSKVASRLPLTK